jgi:hypothetical protein
MYSGNERKWKPYLWNCSVLGPAGEVVQHSECSGRIQLEHCSEAAPTKNGGPVQIPCLVADQISHGRLPVHRTRKSVQYVQLPACIQLEHCSGTEITHSRLGPLRPSLLPRPLRPFLTDLWSWTRKAIFTGRLQTAVLTTTELYSKSPLSHSQRT